MSVLPKVEPEAVADSTANLPLPSELPADRKARSVDPPQRQTVIEQVTPSKASTMLVVAWIAAAATLAGLVIWASLVTVCRC
jgi:hypothetical protein